jgi:hypothetical protein
MTLAGDRSGALEFDRVQAQERWLRALPPEVREGLLRARDVARLLDRTERFMEEGDASTLEEFDADVYRIASELEARFGQTATLRFLRDELSRALAPCLSASPEAARDVLRVLNRAADAIWRAHTDRLKEAIEVQHYERIRNELMVAKRIQERLLPRTIPNIPGFDIAGRVLPAAEVGGDYWSCKNYPEDDIVTFKLADVTGHGIAAATLVAAVKFISGGYYRGAKTAAQVLERTNSVLVRETPHDILVTMVYGWLYPRSNEMTIVNAGHSPVLHYQRGTFRRIEPTGIAMGMVETKYSEVRISIEPGDLFFTCSDGVTNPMADGALGEEWVQERIVAGLGLSASDLVENILEEALEAYKSPLDDMSVVIVKRTE